MVLLAFGILVGFAQRGSAEELRSLAEAQSGIVVRFAEGSFRQPRGSWSISGAEPSSEELTAYLPLFVQEWSLLPRPFVEPTRLRRIVIAADLACSGERRGAIPDFRARTLYYDARIAQHSPAYRRRTVHHEFFHFVDFADEGGLEWQEDWTDLNPPGFRYGRPRSLRGDSDPGRLLRSVPGFLTEYSTYDIGEDKAELFSWMMTEGEVVARRCRNDARLAAKVRVLRAALRRFCPDIDRGFWERIRTRTADGR